MLDIIKGILFKYNFNFFKLCIILIFCLYFSEETSKSLSDTIKVGAFVVNKPVTVNEENFVIPDVPFSSLLAPRQTSPPPVSTAETTCTKTATTNITTDSSNGNNERLTNDNATSKCNSQNGSRRSSCSMASANDDFIMVDLVINVPIFLV